MFIGGDTIRKCAMFILRVANNGSCYRLGFVQSLWLIAFEMFFHPGLIEFGCHQISTFTQFGGLVFGIPFLKDIATKNVFTISAFKDRISFSDKSCFIAHP